MADAHEPPEYVALIGDIRGSRTLEDRQAAQREFRTVVEALDEELPDDETASPFTVTTGDEFQGLLTDAGAALEAAIAASDRLHPLRLRFGLGRGPLETDLNREQAIGMDGPCFHRAREAVQAARADETWLRVAGWPDGLDPRVNPLFDLVGCVRADWTDRQAEFAHALQAAGTQTQVAEAFDVAKSTVSESLSAGHVHEVRAAETALAELLQHPRPTREP